MMVLITYDVNVTSESGAKRLRRISKVCLNYGQRVQNSVFECVIDYGTFLMVKKQLLVIYDESRDSLRFYVLGNKWNNKVEHFGVKEGYDPTCFLMI